MHETIMAIEETVNLLLDNLHRADEGNKAAALRARKATLVLAKLGKTFRQQSIEEMK